ncbi:MAG: hypothetical protein AB1585_20485, partial [Thermodesulfobacteriota bacterium]
NYFKAFNANDENAYQIAHHFPHIRINDKAEVSIVMNASELLPLKLIQNHLIRTENWDHSFLDSLELVHASANKVHFNIQFSRYKKEGLPYVTYKALWVVTQKEGRWGILARSTYAP